MRHGSCPSMAPARLLVSAALLFLFTPLGPAGAQATFDGRLLDPQGASDRRGTPGADPGPEPL